ncbi:MAG: phosphatidyl-myo-inositol alpha-mannosyltransferase [Thermoplasmata archaeon]|jgi:glycosyltransferase involved in cell wall biosynthesis|nr:phosphatidyl-myo-inositol alpha-mannosyltransferase [Thermoplasmata archaeon]
MKVLLASLDSIHTLQGGVEWYVHHLAEALADEGHEVRVATRQPQRQPQPSATDYRFLPMPRGAASHRYRLLWSPRFARRLAKEAAWADVVHGQNEDGMGALGVRPVVATVHTTPLDEWASSRLGGWRETLYQRRLQALRVARWRRFAPRAETIWTPGAHVAESLRELGARRVEIAPNPVAPLPRFGQKEARDALGLPAGPLVLYLGRLARVKRVDRLLDATPPGATLLIAGEGPEESALRQRAGPHVRFLGRVDDATKARLYAAADVLALPSEHEGQPLVLLEAMSVGTPVVATRAEWVPPGLRGFGLWGDDLPRLLREALAKGRGQPAPVTTYRETARRFSEEYKRLARGARA